MEVTRIERWSSWSMLLVCVCVVGCRRAEVPEFVASSAVNELAPELKSAVQAELVKQSGSFLRPKMLPLPDEQHGDLARGQAVYQERCVQCHGVSGDGNGPSAKFMYPRPRDYRKGMFKFSSTPYGYRPMREDLLRTVRQGIRGTSMPGFNLLPDADQKAVVEYVVALSRRGELEEQLVGLADAEGALEAELVETEAIATVVGRWSDAEGAEVLPASQQPKLTSEHVERGKKAFLTKGCSKCHGEDGRGQTAENRFNDAWGNPTRAADLTSGMLHGGNRPVDIYRRIYNGISGTPMPGFANALREEPETMWDLVAYVLSVSSQRRQGVIPVPGTIRPYVSAVAAPGGAAPGLAAPGEVQP